MFFFVNVLCLFVILVISHFGFDGRTLVLFSPVPGHCLPFYLTLYKKNVACLSKAVIKCRNYFGELIR